MAKKQRAEGTYGYTSGNAKAEADEARKKIATLSQEMEDAAAAIDYAAAARL